MYENNYNKNTRYGNQNGRNNNNNNGGNKPKSIGAIWKAVSKNGANYFKIKLGDKYYVAFTNNYKQDSKSPEFYIYEIQQVNGNSKNGSTNNYGNQENNNYTNQNNDNGYNNGGNYGSENRYGSKNSSNNYSVNNRYGSNQSNTSQYNNTSGYGSENNNSQTNSHNVSDNIEKTNEEIDDIPSLSF